MQSWRTTVLGILTIVGVVTGAAISFMNGHTPDLTAVSAGITTGVGLILAADHKNLPPKA